LERIVASSLKYLPSECGERKTFHLRLQPGMRADRDGFKQLLDSIAQFSDPAFKDQMAKYLSKIAEQIDWSDADRPLIDQLEGLMLDTAAGVRLQSALAAKMIGAPAHHTTATLRKALAMGTRGEVPAKDEWYGVAPGSLIRSLIAASIWSLEGGDALSGKEKATRCADFPADIQPLACFAELEGVLP
jgi:hypothetical protein